MLVTVNMIVVFGYHPCSDGDEGDLSIVPLKANTRAIVDLSGWLSAEWQLEPTY